MTRRQTSDYKATELAGYSCVAACQKTPFSELDLNRTAARKNSGAGG